MLKIGVLGANGQVGSVVCAHLDSTNNCSVVAICRNNAGAALVPCLNRGEVRLGSMSDQSSAEKLLGDCDAVINCAWSSALPKQALDDNLGILKQLATLKKFKAGYTSKQRSGVWVCII